MQGVVVPFDQRVAAHGVFSAAWELVEVDVSIEEGSIVRRLSVDDIDVFRRIRLEALSHEPFSFASVFGDWVHLSDREWRQHLDQPVFVAFLSGQPVGMMGLRFERARKMTHRTRLVSVYVRKDNRRTGIAAKLLHDVTEHARDRGVLQVELAVSADNSAAIRFYQRHGFVEVGRIPNGFLGHGTENDELIMVLRLARERG
ncbi:GNAT family N-acetyltransferase [Sinorhizobium medicae]|uniref:GNAT family N-acetyltransferase n=1 Tax=Sinorhizobium medicae TaxID=110321 RepID=UPI0011ACA81F|nr:GNAT family N-acetyltransferase [Sinorhizobium medicae]TWA46573.1 acetyltransferase (GNAT) family protein [Sinorhizobium medicae]